MMANGEQYLAIDARPYNKYLGGSIPGSIGIPYKDFAAKRGMLPAAKTDVTLVYFCGGYKCTLSHQSAILARSLGYKKVVVAESGYPGWKAMFGGSEALAVKAGGEEGVVDTAWFLETIKADPAALTIVDVRTPEEFAAGHFPTAINLSADQIEKDPSLIPTGKPIVFSCASGGRAGEAFYIYMDMKPEAKDVFYLEATNEFGEDNSYDVQPNK